MIKAITDEILKNCAADKTPQTKECEHSFNGKFPLEI